MVRPTPFTLVMKFRNFGKTLFGPVRKYAVNYCSHLKAFTHIRMCARVCVAKRLRSFVFCGLAMHFRF